MPSAWLLATFAFFCCKLLLIGRPSLVLCRLALLCRLGESFEPRESQRKFHPKIINVAICSSHHPLDEFEAQDGRPRQAQAKAHEDGFLLPEDGTGS